jgi:hypothetical protein
MKAPRVKKTLKVYLDGDDVPETLISSRYSTTADALTEIQRYWPVETIEEMFRADTWLKGKTKDVTTLDITISS